MTANRIGLLTGGGDCPGLNAVIRAVSKSAHRDGLAVVGFQDGFDGLLENRSVVLDDAMVSGILTRGGTILGTTNAADPYRYPLRNADGTHHFADLSERAIATFRQHRLQALLVIGGDGTMSIAHRLARDGLKIVGIPKTIDNDLVGTEVTFGFETAVATATEAIDRIHTTAQSHSRVMIVEVMGRYAGWIALFAGMAGGGDLILIPEIPYRLDAVYAKIRERNQGGKNYTIVVVAEGAKPVGGTMTVQRRIETSPDPIRLGGVASVLAAAIEEDLAIETRATILGHVQRGGTPTAGDRILATRFGTHAIELVRRRHFGQMVVYNNSTVGEIPLAEVNGTLKLVPLDHPLIRSARAVGTSFGDGD